MYFRFVSILTMLLITASAIAQESISDNQDGHTVFYYPNGNISSEGHLVEGKPDGYWKSYYEDGTLKAEGNRRFFLLDSIWTFYFPDGKVSQKISYRNDLRNGYTINYDYRYDSDSVKHHYKSSKILYLNGKREGLSFYYDYDSRLKYSYNYRNDKRSGRGKEYNQDSVVISLFEYFDSYLISRVQINRLDNSGNKQGKWIEFHPNGNKKLEKHYLNNKLHGLYIEYDLGENKIREKLYHEGEIYVPAEEDTEIELLAEIKTAFYPDGTIQFQGAFIDSIPVGIHREFEKDGSVITAKEYNREGLLVGEGLFDENGLRTGKWKLYDIYYQYVYAEGNYLNGKKQGVWIYYYPDKTTEQQGAYNEDRPEGEWIWYYRNGKIKREENYSYGKLEGEYTEYDIEGNIVLKGEYFDGARQGEWYYNVGNVTKKGSYEAGARSGVWKYEYNNTGNLFFEGKFNNGDPDGTHKYYYNNRSIRLIAEYRMGNMHGNWREFTEDGNLWITRTFRNNELTRVDGNRIRNR